MAKSDKAKFTIYIPQNLKEKFERLTAIRRRSLSGECEVMIEAAVKEAEASGELSTLDDSDNKPLSDQEFAELQKFFEFLIGKNGKNGFSITHIADFMGINTTELAKFYKALKATKETNDATVDQPAK